MTVEDRQDDRELTLVLRVRRGGESAAQSVPVPRSVPTLVDAVPPLVDEGKDHVSEVPQAGDYSAQYTAPVPYLVPAPVYEGKAHATEMPVIGGVATLLSNFVVGADNRLHFSGAANAAVSIKAKLSFGNLIPSQSVAAPLDHGPKASIYGYIQVGDKKSEIFRSDQTLYIPPYEYPLIYYSFDVDTIMEVCPGEALQFFVWYEWRALPPPTIPDPATFYLTFGKTNLSWVINSSAAPNQGGKEPHPPREGEAKNVLVGLGPNLNTKVFEFKSGVSGKTLIHVRVNIDTTSVYNNDTGLTTPLINIGWHTYLSINGNLTPANLIYQTVTNQPNIFNPTPAGPTTWPDSQELLLLADLKQEDKVGVIVNFTEVMATNPNPPYLLPIPDGHGTVTTNLSFKMLLSPPLFPDAAITPSYYNTLTLPMDGTLATAATLPLDGCTVRVFDPDHNFEVKAGKLYYRGNQKKRFKIRSSLVFDKFFIENSDLDPAIIGLQMVGFAIGLNGVAQNTIETVNNIYSDVRYGNLKWLATQSAANTLRLKKGDEISCLMYSFNAVYLNVPPQIGTIIPNYVPPPGSKVVMKVAISLVIE